LFWGEEKVYSRDLEILFLPPKTSRSLKKSINNLKYDTKVNLN
jgi:hypothetical protein